MKAFLLFEFILGCAWAISWALIALVTQIRAWLV
jgi:hypothetical protein